MNLQCDVKKVAHFVLNAWFQSTNVLCTSAEDVKWWWYFENMAL